MHIDMHSNKVRSTVIALAVSASAAIFSATPAVSHAQWLHYCVNGHCVTSPTAPKSTIGGAGKSPCEANKAADLLPSEEDVDTFDDHLVAVAIWEVEQERKAEEKRDKEDEKDAEEAKVAEAERAAFESGCDPAGLHTK